MDTRCRVSGDSPWTPQSSHAPWADLWDVDESTLRSPDLDASSSINIGLPTPSVFPQTLSQDVQAAVEEIDSIVNELWRTALPKDASVETEKRTLSSQTVTCTTVVANSSCPIEAFSTIEKFQNEDQNDLPAVPVNIESSGSDLKNVRSKHKCDKCEKCYIWMNDLVKHQKAHSGKRHLCSECNKSYVLKSDLYKHQRSHQKDKAYVCEDCGKSFISSGDLHKHLRIHTGERPYLCNICNKSFSASDNFRKHLKIHSGDKPLVCIHCGQRFLKKCNLQQHSRIHLGEKPFQCEICGLSFTQKTHLSTHISTHSGLKPFNCSSCNQSFTRNADLKRHISRAHAIATENRGL